MILSQNKPKYGLTEVFLKHWYYSKLRIKLLRDNLDGTYTLLEDLGDGLREVKVINTTKKIYNATDVKVADGSIKSFLSFIPDFDVKYIYEKGDYSVLRYKYIMHVGSSRSSKSFSLEEAAIKECEETPNLRVNVWRDTRQSLGDTIWKDFKKVFPLSGRDYKFTKNTIPIYFNNGSVIEPHGADATNAHGITQDIAWLNEPYKIPKETFDQIDQRAEQMWMDLNPKEGYFLDDVANHPRCIKIHSTFLDNPFCPPGQKLKILSYDPNNPINVSNGTVDEYMHSVYALGLAAEKPNKIYHNWKKMSYAEFVAIDFPSVYGLDWGVVHPMGVIEVKYYDGTFYFHELSYLSENNLIAELNSIYGHSYQEELKKLALGVVTWHLQRIGVDKKKVIVCDSAKPDKIIELRRAGYNAIPAHKPAGSVYSGISMLKRANVQYTDTSHNMDNEYNSYEWNTDRYGLVTEEPIKKDDDLMDPARYACSYLQLKLRLNL